MSTKIEITIEQLEYLLNRQKRIVIDKLKGCTSYWNGESTPAVSKAINIDDEKFLESGLESKFPEDFIILKKYIK